jgi:putative endonuclease
MSRNQRIGRWGEQIAKEYLEKHGLKTLDQNVRTPFGELDLIACTEDTLVFIEVKTRTSAAFGFPEAAVDLQKKEHLVHCAEAYLQMHPEIQKDWRIDVIAIQKKSTQETPEIEWFENAVS